MSRKEESRMTPGFWLEQQEGSWCHLSRGRFRNSELEEKNEN